MSFLSALQIAIPTDPTMLLWLLIILIIIGLIAIIIIGFLFAFPVAALAAILVWFLTSGDLIWTAVTFLVVALISAVVGRIWRATYHHRHPHERID